MRWRVPSSGTMQSIGQTSGVIPRYGKRTAASKRPVAKVSFYTAGRAYKSSLIQILQPQIISQRSEKVTWRCLTSPAVVSIMTAKPSGKGQELWSSSLDLCFAFPARFKRHPNFLSILTSLSMLRPIITRQSLNFAGSSFAEWMYRAKWPLCFLRLYGLCQLNCHL